MAWQTTPILDSGAGADTNPLAGNWAGAANLEANQWKRLSNQLAPATSPAASRWSATTFGINQECYFTIPTIQSGGGIYIAAYIRGTNLASGTASYLQAFFAMGAAGAFTLSVFNTASLLGSTVAGTLVNGDVIGIQAVGANVRVFQNQTLLASRTATTVLGTGQIALSAAGGNWRVTNFAGGNYTARPRTTRRNAPPAVAPAGAYLN